MPARRVKPDGATVSRGRMTRPGAVRASWNAVAGLWPIRPWLTHFALFRPQPLRVNSAAGSFLPRMNIHTSVVARNMRWDRPASLIPSSQNTVTYEATVFSPTSDLIVLFLPPLPILSSSSGTYYPCEHLCCFCLCSAVFHNLRHSEMETRRSGRMRQGAQPSDRERPWYVIVTWSIPTHGPPVDC